MKIEKIMTQKTVLITGCSSGIGQALALEFQKKGYQVFATARRFESIANLEGYGIIPLTLDVNDQASIQDALAQIQHHAAHLTCLVNNAGYAAMGPIIELSDESLQQQFMTNVFAPMALIRACLPLLKVAAKQKNSEAQIVNMGSISGIMTTPFSGAYCATKSALHSLSDALRMELHPFGIKVITVQPGAIQSKFGENSLANMASLIPSESLYTKLQKNIEARAMASQNNPTPAAEFAEQLVQQLRRSPKAEIKLGKGSTVLPALKRYLPIHWLDTILMKKFGLK